MRGDQAEPLPRHARVVVIGGGVVGCSLLYHLALSGWQDCLLLEANELTSGSSWHAAGNCPNFSASWAIMRLQRYSTALYATLGETVGYPINFHRTGALRLAQSEERRREFELVTDMAQHQGLAFEMLSPAEAAARHPFLETRGLLAAQWDPGDGDIDPAQLTQAFAKGARDRGAVIRRYCKVTGLERGPGGDWLVRTAAGSVTAEIVVNAAGYRAAELGALVGRDLPCVALSHQYLITEAIPVLAGRGTKLPLLRDPDDSYYLRQEGEGLLLGPYERQPRAHWLEGLPDDFAFQLFPDELERLTPQIEAAVGRVPLLATAGIKRVVNGPIPYTPDGNPLLGPAPGLRKFYEACVFSFGIVQAGGAGKALADWIVEGEPPWDLWALDPRRFTEHVTRSYSVAKALELYAHEYDIGFPFEERPAGRPAKISPLYRRLAAMGAQFGARNGWERATWFAGDGEDPAACRLSLTGPGFAAAIARECRAVAERVGIVDLPGFSKFRLRGPGAAACLDRLIAGRLPGVGRVTLAYVCTAKGGLLSEFTVTRLAADDFLLIGAGSAEWHDRDLLTAALPADGEVSLENATAQLATLLVTGPASRALLAEASGADLGSAAFPWLSARYLRIGDAQVLALRVSYAGELGWELHLPPEQLPGAYDTLWQAGAVHGLANVGIHALDSLRLEKGYRAWKQDLEIGYSPLAAGLGRFVDLGKLDFPGRVALLAEQRRGPAQRLATLLFERDDLYTPALASVFHQGRRVGLVTSGGVGHRLGRSLALAYLRSDLAVTGQELEVAVFGRAVPARVGLDCPYDPANDRLKA